MSESRLSKSSGGIVIWIKAAEQDSPFIYYCVTPNFSVVEEGTGVGFNTDNDIFNENILLSNTSKYFWIK